MRYRHKQVGGNVVVNSQGIRISKQESSKLIEIGQDRLLRNNLERIGILLYRCMCMPSFLC